MTPELKAGIINIAKLEYRFKIDIPEIGLTINVSRYLGGDYYLSLSSDGIDNKTLRYKTHAEVIKKLEEVL